MNMDNPEYLSALIRDLNEAYGLAMVERQEAESLLPEPGQVPAAEQLENLLADKLNTLIRDDFNGLVGLLYRIDINEARLRQLLQSNQGTDAGKIIARLIIDRQLQKIESRRAYKKSNPAENDCGEEKW
jgi:hypothetical protein